MNETGQLTTDGRSRPQRVLFLPQNPHDAESARRVFAEKGVSLTATDDLSRLVDEVDSEAGCLLIAEEKLRHPDFIRLVEAIEGQPEWSDLPIIIVTREDGGSRRVWDLTKTANVTVVERPLRIETLLTVVRSALRDRDRQREIRDSIANRDHFLAMVGHELRNPLTSILLALQIQDDTDDPAIQVIHRQVEVMQHIVDDLRDISRIQRGEISFDRQHLDLVDLTEKTVEDFVLIAENQELQLTVDLPDGPLWVRGDAARLAQVLGNLLSNAIRYTPEGGRIDVEAGCIDETVVVSVRDTGVGIAADELDHIFDVFAQGRTNGEESNEGLGLGLNLAHSIVEQHDGELIAESPGEGKGSTFSICLPAAPRTEVGRQESEVR